MVTSTTRTPKVFLDSSVLFAASRSQKGFARDLLVAGILGRAALFLSPFVVDETRRNLARKSPHVLPFYESFLTRGLVQAVEPPAMLVQQAAAFIAHKDAEIVAGAVHAGTTFLATYDRKDPLAKRQEILTAFGVTVATPDEILASLRNWLSVSEPGPAPAPPRMAGVLRSCAVAAGCAGRRRRGRRRGAPSTQRG